MHMSVQWIHCGSRSRLGILLHHHGALLLGLLHLSLFVAIVLPKSTVQHLSGCIVHLPPAVEASTLAQSAHSIRESVVHVVEEHLVPTMWATQHHGHDEH